MLCVYIFSITFPILSLFGFKVNQFANLSFVFLKSLLFFSIFLFLFLNLKSENYYIILLNFSVVTAVAISAFFLSEIFFVNTIGVLVFWLNIGYSCYFIEKDSAKNT